MGELPVIDQLVAKLKQEEGFRPTLYRDTVGVWTIGYGFTYLTRDEADAVLQLKAVKVMAEAAEILGPLWSGLSPTRQRVLAEMVYQIGPAGLRNFRQFRAAVQAGNHEQAAAELLDSKAAEQTPERWKRHAEDWLHG